MHQNKWPGLTGVPPGREKKVLEKTYVYYILLCNWDIECKKYIMYIYKSKYKLNIYIYILSIYVYTHRRVQCNWGKVQSFDTWVLRVAGINKWAKRMWDRHRGTVPVVVVRMILLPRPVTVIYSEMDMQPCVHQILWDVLFLREDLSVHVQKSKVAESHRIKLFVGLKIWILCLKQMFMRAKEGGGWKNSKD